MTTLSARMLAGTVGDVLKEAAEAAALINPDTESTTLRAETVGEVLERFAAMVGRKPKAELDTIHLRLAGSPAVALPVAVNLRGH